MPLSTITNPFLDPAGSARSNVYSPSANTIGIVTSGIDRVRVDSSGNIGVGTTSPAGRLHVSTTSADAEVRCATTTANYASFRVKNSTNDYSMQIRTDQSNAWTLRDETAGLNRVLVDTSGRVLMPYQIMFSAQRSSGVTAPAVIPFDTIVTNVGGHYSTSTGRFTSPVAGIFLFYTTYTLDRTTNTGDIYCDIRKNGSIFLRVYTNGHSDASAHPTQSGEIILPMAIGDYVDVYYANGPSGIHANSIHNVFGGHLIG
jgi:hypothetical protein